MSDTYLSVTHLTSKEPDSYSRGSGHIARVAAMFFLFFGAGPALAQLITSPVALHDSNRDGLIRLDALAAKVTPAQKRGTIVTPCGGNVYAVKGTLCKAPEQPEAITAPRIAAASFPGAGNVTVNTATKGIRSGVSVNRVMDGYVLNGDGITISDSRIGAARYGATTRNKSGGNYPFSNATISRIDWTASKAGILLHGGAHDVLIEDAVIKCSVSSEDFPAGIQMGTHGAVNGQYNIRINRFRVSGCKSTDKSKYQQGDGISTEAKDHDITFTNGSSTDNGDGCLDLKSHNTRLDNVYVARCNFGLRAWTTGTAGTLRAGDVNKAVIQLKGGTNWTIDRLYLPAAVPKEGDVRADKPGGKLAVKWCSRPIVKTGQSATLELGPTCK